LVYALTWYGMALMLAGAAIYILRGRRTSRPGGE
ncbi:MAG: SURF1 family protein, partial [Alphaproteobacteria bacterium]